MATTYYSDTAGQYMPPRSTVGDLTVPFTFNQAALNYANGDIIVLAKLPRFSTLTGFIVDMPILDTANTLAMGLGTLSNSTRFTSTINTGAAIRISAFDAAATANTSVLLAKLPFAVLNTTAGGQTVDDDLRLTVSNTATTIAANAVIRGFAQFVCNEPLAQKEVRPTT